MNAETDCQENHGVEVIEVRFAIDTETSVHKVFVRNPGRSLRDVIEPICALKGVELTSLGIYLGSDRSASLPLDCDIHTLTGHALHVIDYKAPVLALDEVDGKLFGKKSSYTIPKTTPLTQRKALFETASARSTPTAQRKAKSAATAVRVSSFAGKFKDTAGNFKSKPPVVARKSAPTNKEKLAAAGEMYPQRLSTGNPPLAKTISGTSMLSQPGGRRSRQSEVQPPMISSRLLGLSEGNHKKEHSTFEDDNGNEVVLRSHQKHRKQMSLPADDFHSSGDVSPGGTLVKNRSSLAKLNMFSLQPQNSKSQALRQHTAAAGVMSSQQLLVSLIHSPNAVAFTAPRHRFNSLSQLNMKEREKMEILADLLEQWEKTGPPEMPPLHGIGLPKFDPAKFEIEDHWTNFIDKTGLTQRQKDQQEALWELLYTESEYIRALYVIHDLFICCLLNIQNSGVLNEINIDGMFSNVTELATTNSDFWSNELIAVLEHSRKNKCLFNPSLLKPAFSNFSEKFMPYTKYCIEQKKCSDYVKKTYHDLTMFKSFVVWAEAQKQCNRLKLHDLLVKPMQRMTRYGLLLRAIHKKTDEEDVKQDLMEMIKNVDKFVTDVDQTLTKADEKEKLTHTADRIEAYDAIDIPLVDSESSKILTQTYMTLDLLSPMPSCGNQLRYNLLEGPLKLRDMGAKIDVHCILFTDMLLFTKPSKREKLRIIKPPIRIDSLSIHEMKDSPYLLLIHLTDFGVAQAAYTLQGDNINKWAKTFKKAQMMYMKAKEQTRKESLHMSLTDLELDDFGFSGPLASKNSDPVFSDGADNDSDVAQSNPSPQVQRASSFSSLNEAETEDGDAGLPTATAIPQSASSPDIGRKHHTLPHNYKHPPRVSLQRKSSSSSGESNGTLTKSKEARKSPLERKHRSANGRSTAAATNHSDSNSSDSRVAWQFGNQNVEDSDDDFAMSAQLNCDIKPSNLDSNSSVDGPLRGITNPSLTVNNSDYRSSPKTATHNGHTHLGSQSNSDHALSRDDHLPRAPRTTYSAGNLIDSSPADRGKSKKANHINMLRMQQFKDFLNDSSPGVEI